MKAETRQIGKARFYPCENCVIDHPSITTLLDVMGSRALMGWSAKNGVAKLHHLWGVLGPEIAKQEPLKTIVEAAEKSWVTQEGTHFWKSGKQIGQEAADVGTMVHAAIEMHLSGKGVDRSALPAQGQAAFDGFMAWHRSHKLKTIKTEQTFYHCKMGYAGTCDWIGEVDGELTLIDWKTSNGIYSNYIIQVFAYALADESQHGDRLYRQVGIGRFGKSGDWEVKLYRRTDFPGIEVARDMMAACKTIFDFNQKYEAMFPYIRKNGNGGPNGHPGNAQTAA